MASKDAIATVWNDYPEKENDANARLIAAAPERAEALAALVEWATDPRLGLIAAQI